MSVSDTWLNLLVMHAFSFLSILVLIPYVSFPFFLFFFLILSSFNFFSSSVFVGGR